MFFKRGAAQGCEPSPAGAQCHIAFLAGARPLSCPPGEWCQAPAGAWATGCASYPQKGTAIVFLTGNFFKIKYFKYSSSPFLSSCTHPALASALFHSTSRTQQRSSQRWKAKICSCVCDCPFQPRHVRQHRPSHPRAMGGLLKSCAEGPDPGDALQSVEGDAGQGGSSCLRRSQMNLQMPQCPM